MWRFTREDPSSSVCQRTVLSKACWDMRPRQTWVCVCVWCWHTHVVTASVLSSAPNTLTHTLFFVLPSSPAQMWQLFETPSRLQLPVNQVNPHSERQNTHKPDSKVCETDSIFELWSKMSHFCSPVDVFTLVELCWGGGASWSFVDSWSLLVEHSGLPKLLTLVNEHIILISTINTLDVVHLCNDTFFYIYCINIFTTSVLVYELISLSSGGSDGVTPWWDGCRARIQCSRALQPASKLFELTWSGRKHLLIRKLC